MGVQRKFGDQLEAATTVTVSPALLNESTGSGSRASPGTGPGAWPGSSALRNRATVVLSSLRATEVVSERSVETWAEYAVLWAARVVNA